MRNTSECLGFTQIVGGNDSYPAFIGIRMSDSVLGLGELTVLDSSAGHHTVLRAGSVHALEDVLKTLKNILCEYPEKEKDE